LVQNENISVRWI